MAEFRDQRATTPKKADLDDAELLGSNRSRLRPPLPLQPKTPSRSPLTNEASPVRVFRPIVQSCLS